MNRIVPTSALDDNQEPVMARFIRELCDVPQDEWSAREKRIMDNAFAHGELYHANSEEVIGEHESYRVLSTDLGDPDSKIELRVPLNIDEKKALQLLQELAEGLFV